MVEIIALSSTARMFIHTCALSAAIQSSYDDFVVFIDAFLSQRDERFFFK